MNLKFKIESSKLVEIIILGSIIGLLATGTYYRNEIWGSGINLWRDTAKKSPNKPRPAVNLSTALAQQGRFEEARMSLAEFKRRHPDYPVPASLRAWARP